MICVVYEYVIIRTAIHNLATASFYRGFVAKNCSIKVFSSYSVSNIILSQLTI